MISTFSCERCFYIKHIYQNLEGTQEGQNGVNRTIMFLLCKLEHNVVPQRGTLPYH